MMASHLLHQAHQEHVVVNGKVGLLEDRCQLKLVWCYLVVTGLARNTELKSLDFQILHECLNTLRDGAEVMVVHLLVLGRIVTHQGATCQHQIRTCSIQAFIYQEVLLLPTEIGNNFLDIRVEVVANICSSYVYSVQCTEQWSFIVESLTCVRDEDGRDTECIVDDKYRRCWVPCRITASLEG